MLAYKFVCLFIGLNFILYVTIHIPLDLKVILHRKRAINSNSKSRAPPEWDSNLTMIITLLSTVYLWILFIIIPLTAILNENVFYNFLISSEPFTTFFQILGIFIIGIATVIASLGRISRGDRAISWGIPKKLEIHGIFRFIRHPLYASYCYYFIGFNLVFQTLVLLPLLLGIYGYFKTSLYEESVLIEHFKDEYTEYQRKTGRFLPRLRSIR